MMCDVVMTLVGTLLGGVLGWATSRHYARKAAAELEAATDALRRSQQLTLYAFLNRDAEFEPVLDEQGRYIIGIKVKAAGRA
jgi:hypothetical protein